MSERDQVVADAECAALGHLPQADIMAFGSHEPVAIICGRCGRTVHTGLVDDDEEDRHGHHR